MKTILLIISTFFLSHLAIAQFSFFHGGGGAFAMLNEGSGPVIGPGAYYMPRLNYELKENHSICLSSNMSILLSGGGAALSFPILFGYNFGDSSVDESGKYSSNIKKIGLFINAGYGNLLYASDDEGYSSGPAFNFGIRAWQGFETGLYYMFDSVDPELNFTVFYFGYTWSL